MVPVEFFQLIIVKNDSNITSLKITEYKKKLPSTNFFLYYVTLNDVITKSIFFIYTLKNK